MVNGSYSDPRREAELLFGNKRERLLVTRSDGEGFEEGVVPVKPRRRRKSSSWRCHAYYERSGIVCWSGLKRGERLEHRARMEGSHILYTKHGQHLPPSLEIATRGVCGS